MAIATTLSDVLVYISSHTVGAAEQATQFSPELYQLYLDNGLWFELVAALAANAQAEEGAALLQKLGTLAVDPIPQTLTPVTLGQ
ncbi:hypothetical protein [Nodosilinea sp. E11]|uniref:hypothetical protein n=1 Tax=Nodosilinea sp. E11 TaxID=3037479 RepID=UPI002934FD4B|nr:hypothetical protein [Nodosilinea sp. E11]WOD39793.1 hypothetical protein RRF56_03155 [Nodosilinea sp. E11]